MTFWEHLDELRKRLVRSALWILIGAIGGFALSPYVQDFLIKPFIDKVPGTLALLAPSDGFVIQIKISLLLGLLLASPFVAWQLYGFVGPGLKREEKRWMFPVVIIATLLFWSGVLFAWYVLPTALQFLGSFSQEGLENIWSLKKYIGLVLFLILAFGFIFQLPLVIGLLVGTGLVPSKFFRRNRRFAIVFIFILAALATPTTDAVTMLMMVTPLLFLYELSIWIGVLLEKRRAKNLQEAPETALDNQP